MFGNTNKYCEKQNILYLVSKVFFSIVKLNSFLRPISDAQYPFLPSKLSEKLILMSKKKDQQKFNEYSINTDDAWEIDDGTMTLKIIDNDEDDDLGVSKQIDDIQQHKFNKITLDTSVGKENSESG